MGCWAIGMGYWANLQFPVDLGTFTEKILSGKLHCFCSVKTKLSLALDSAF